MTSNSVGITYRVHRIAESGAVREKVQDYGTCGLKVAVEKANAYAAATPGHYALVQVELIERTTGSLELPTS